MQLNLKHKAQAIKLVFDNQEIAVVDEFKYFGSYVGSTTKNVKTRIALAWGAFNKIRSILKAQ